MIILAMENVQQTQANGFKNRGFLIKKERLETIFLVRSRNPKVQHAHINKLGKDDPA